MVSGFLTDEGDHMALLALCGERRELSIKRVRLNASLHEEVTLELGSQETYFRSGQEVPFDQNWTSEDDEISTVAIPEDEGVFDQIYRSTDTSLQPMEDIGEVRGLAMQPDGSPRILVQAFFSRQVFGKGPLAMFGSPRGYSRLEKPGLELGTSLVCIVEDGQLKFRNLTHLSRVIDTAAIFHEATNEEVRTFADTLSNLFEFDGGDVDRFVSSASSRAARKCIASLNASGVLRNRSAEDLRRAAEPTNLTINIRDDKIVMPTRSSEITSLMRFLNDGRYVGPVSGNVLISNSQRPA